MDSYNHMIDNMQDVITLNVDPESEFSLLGEIGRGNYGKVHKAQRIKDGKVFAIKIVPYNQEIESLKKEIAILKQCSCNYIVKFFGAFVKDQDLWLVLEYCDAGSVQDIIKMTGRTLNE